jgi:hypothetical protein
MSPTEGVDNPSQVIQKPVVLDPTNRLNSLLLLVKPVHIQKLGEIQALFP